MAGEATTLLTLSGPDVPPYSARGLTQSFEIIEAQTNLRRTINGALLDLSLLQFRKYRTRISGNDQQPPALDGWWPGMAITIGSCAELAYKTGSAGAPHRTAVSGSERVEGAFSFYRPVLICRLMAFNTEFDEWGAAVSWELEAEEQ